MPNKCSLEFHGHICGRDPEIRFTPKGKSICNFSVMFYTGKKEEQKPPVFLNFKAFGDNAEAIGAMNKGDVIHILEASPVMEVWETKTGEKREKQVWIAWKVEGAGEKVEDIIKIKD